MKSELGAWGAVVGMAILACLFGGLALAIYPGWAVIGNFFDTNIQLSEHAPSWVQAVGSLVALAIAIAVPATQFAYENKRRAKEAARQIAREVAVHVAVADRVFSALVDANNQLSRPLGTGGNWGTAASYVAEAERELVRMKELPYNALPTYTDIRAAYDLLDSLSGAVDEAKRLDKLRSAEFSLKSEDLSAFAVMTGTVQRNYAYLAERYWKAEMAASEVKGS